MRASKVALICATGSLLIVSTITSMISTFGTSLNGKNLVPGFIDIQLTLNRGVSFSLLTQESELGSKLLTVATAAIVAMLGLWAYQATRPLQGAALGTIIGGALYNTGDRALNGGVFDFLGVRIGSMQLFVCNAADIAISLGVLLFMVDMVMDRDTAQLKR